MAMRGIEALHRNDVPFHCISVLTEDAMEQPERMYRFFRDNGIKMLGSTWRNRRIHTSSSMQGVAMERKYRDFLRTFWRLSEQDGYPVVLREFQQVISLIQGNQRMTQNELNRPFSILSVDWQGNFSTFDPELLSVASDRYGTLIWATFATSPWRHPRKRRSSTGCCPIWTVVSRAVRTTASTSASVAVATAATNSGSTAAWPPPKRTPAASGLRFLSRSAGAL